MARPPLRGRGRGLGGARGGGRFHAEPEVEESGTKVEVEDESLSQAEVESQEDAEDASDTQPRGGPEDRSLLVSFNTHVAQAIWQGQERSTLRLHHHPNYLNKWELKDERMKEKIKNSELLPLCRITHYICNSHRVSAFVERWHPETNSFHFDFGDMGPARDDVEQLLENEAKNALAEAKGGQAVTFDWLRLYFRDLRESNTDKRVKYYSRAYLLYVLGCTLFCNETGSKVNVAPLALLENLDRVSHYGWGVSVLAFLYRQLGRATLTLHAQLLPLPSKSSSADDDDDPQPPPAVGMALLWLTTVIPQARPPPCYQPSSICISPITLQLILLCSSFSLMSIGAGGIRSSSLAFGADQLEQHDCRKNPRALEIYFSWYYVSTTFSIDVAITCIVYIQDNIG
ncbi:hypothetical protein Vadar_010646 [Vaccinium darrowii]|uniref:Uncharacterized protein n=1 Tax=Vaccinium darrowii TaxID=229202 RepID=A0ACB7YVF0_9ERIC|nr:hypothetical protein Vadar_010646 [Vaccinium darrowii]